MTSKEALKNFIKTLCEYETDTNNKESVYPCWYRIILEDLERLEKVEKENQKLKNTILSLELDTCIPELRKENAKLKKVIEILKDYFEIWLNYEEEEIFGGFEINGYHQINKQEYELLKEVLENETNKMVF